MSGWQDGNLMLGAPPRKKLWLNRTLAALGWLILSTAGYAIWWTLQRYEREETTISDRMRAWGRSAPPAYLVGFGALAGGGPLFVLGLLAGHWGWR